MEQLILILSFLCLLLVGVSTTLGMVINRFLQTDLNDLLFSSSVIAVASYFCFFFTIAFNLRRIVEWIHGTSSFVSMGIWGKLLLVSFVPALGSVLVWQVIVRRARKRFK